MRRSTRRETQRANDWAPFWWGGRWIKRRLHKIMRRRPSILAITRPIGYYDDEANP